MQVVTLTPSLLSKACSQLSGRIHTAGFDPTLLVGIQSGGAEVARLMRNDFPHAAYCEVKLTRPGTKQKGGGLVHHILQHLPLRLCNLLRMAESRINEWRSKESQPIRLGEIVLPKEAGQTILLVDDAIDTGATIQQARQQLEKRYPDALIRVAVVTVTTAHPLCDADFCLYHNRTLCRFPWSNDYRK